MNAFELTYPRTFRENDSAALEQQLNHRHSVELVGMKRVGINNFLRFFLTDKRNVSSGDIYIIVDLNDLIEREVFPFWRLMFKRIVDATEMSNIDKEYKKRISHYFLDAIQSGDLFMTYDGIRSSLLLLVESRKRPTIIFTRFDRLKDAVTPEFFDNLQGLRTVTGRSLSYIFTSFRELEKLSPTVFKKNLLSGFSHKMYIKPTNKQDSYQTLTALAKQYDLTINEKTMVELVVLSGGHVQYIRLILLIMHELHTQQSLPEYSTKIISDERVQLQSEELWESLSQEEQEVLKKVWKNEVITSDDKDTARYLWDTGILNADNKVFSLLFSRYLDSLFAKAMVTVDAEFSKKEFLLFSVLKENIGTITDREKIVEAVWPESSDFGVSDWSIDRLVARVRNKLKKQKSTMEIITIRTRGYKLTPNN